MDNTYEKKEVIKFWNDPDFNCDHRIILFWVALLMLWIYTVAIFC